VPFLYKNVDTFLHVRCKKFSVVLIDVTHVLSIYSVIYRTVMQLLFPDSYRHKVRKSHFC